MSMKGCILGFSVLLGAPFVVACGSGSTSPPQQGSCEREAKAPAVLVDIDSSFDDIAALAYLCREHDLGRIDLRAVTVTNSGAGYPGKAIKHARCMLKECNLSDVIVADGATPAPNAFPASIRGDADAVLDDAFPGCTESADSTERSAARALVDTIQGEEGSVLVLTSGPLGNLAEALKIDPSIADRVDRVYVMGGAVSVPGNLCCGVPSSFDGSQELTIWVDPGAADAVIRALGSRLMLVPLDATRNVPITRRFGARLAAESVTPEAKVVAAIANHLITWKGVDGGFLYWWGVLSSMAAVHPSVVEAETKGIAVIPRGASAGRTVHAEAATPVQVAISADQAKFEASLIAALNGARASED